MVPNRPHLIPPATGAVNLKSAITPPPGLTCDDAPRRLMAWPSRSSSPGVSRPSVGPRPPDGSLCEGRGDPGVASPALGPPTPGQSSETHLVGPRPHGVVLQLRSPRALVLVPRHAGDGPRLAETTRKAALDLSAPQAWSASAAGRVHRAGRVFRSFTLCVLRIHPIPTSED